MLNFRPANENDVDLLFRWANDRETRNNSYNKEPIPYENHVSWVSKKLKSPDYSIYIFQDEQGEPVGQVRIERNVEAREALISISVDELHRNKGYSSKMIAAATEDFFSVNENFKIIAYVFTTNEPSYRSFLKAGYQLAEEKPVQGIPSYILHKSRVYAQ